MLIRARAPLRLGLAGGGTDITPYCETFGGYVLNATIDRYAYAVIKTLDTPHVRFIAADQLLEITLPLGESQSHKSQLNLHQTVYNEIIRLYHHGVPVALELCTFCDAPPGSGLGASSTLIVAMIRAFCELLNLPLDDYAIAHLAYKIEREDCQLEGGRQDHYSATFGGFNFMEFYADNRAVINPLRIKNWILCELEASLVLFYTGVSRISANIISEQRGNIQKGEATAIQAMHELKKEALMMKECLLKGDFPGMIDSMRQSWDNKKQTASAITTPLIEEVYHTALTAGAYAGKISGAGGGGFLMFFVPPDRRISLMNALSRFNGQISNCHFTKHGTQAWRL